MQDIIITGQRVHKEIRIFLYCLSLMFILNVFSIFWYKTNWFELLSELPFVIILSIAFYIGLAGLRWLKKLFQKSE